MLPTPHGVVVVDGTGLASHCQLEDVLDTIQCVQHNLQLVEYDRTCVRIHN